MDRQQKTKLKKTLLKTREDILSKVKHIEKETLGKSQRDASGDLSGYSFHMADVASDHFEREVSLGLAANERQLLRQIDDALDRLKERDFGKCQECGKNISVKRLSAVPYAQMCIKCKNQQEKSSK